MNLCPSKSIAIYNLSRYPMKYQLYFCKHADCRNCSETTERGFEYKETKKGEKYVFEVGDAYIIVFILSGEALVSCNESTGVPFGAGDIVLWPLNSECSWETVADTASIVLTGDKDLALCDRNSLNRHADEWLNVQFSFKGLTIKPRLLEFLYSVKKYLDDGITCPYIHKVKQRELSLIFRAYYSPEELISFFVPVVRNEHKFESFIMDNYLRLKGVKEFVDLSGMNSSTFNRKFKAHFKETPYQWLIKMKSKHIYHELTSTDKSFADIAKEYYFSDSSHFCRYCKSIFGEAPSKIRRKRNG